MADDFTAADGTISLPKILAKLVEMETSLGYQLAGKADRVAVEDAMREIHSIRERVEDELTRREAEREEIVELTKNRNDNRRLILVALITGVLGLLTGLGPDLIHLLTP